MLALTPPSQSPTAAVLTLYNLLLHKQSIKPQSRIKDVAIAFPHRVDNMFALHYTTPQSPVVLHDGFIKCIVHQEATPLLEINIPSSTTSSFVLI